VKKLKPSYTAGGNVKYYSCFENSLAGPLKVRQSSQDQVIPLPDMYPRDIKTVYTKTCIKMFIAALFLKAQK